MNALHEAAMPSRAELMSGDDYRESLRGYRPRVYVDGRQVESVADERPCGRASMPWPTPMISRGARRSRPSPWPRSRGATAWSAGCCTSTSRPATC